MQRRSLLGVIVFVCAAVRSENFNLECVGSWPTFLAVQDRRYVLEPLDSSAGDFCCARIAAAETESPRLLLMLETLRDVECSKELAAMPRPGRMSFQAGRLYFSKAQLCREPSARYIWAPSRAEICAVKNEASIVGDPAPLMAFLTVAARSLCDSGAWLDASPPLGERLEYVFAPDERLPSLLSESAQCDPSKDYIRTLAVENTTSNSVLAQVLAAPGAGRCRSLFIQELPVRVGENISVPAGSLLTISYNRSQTISCGNNPTMGAVIRLLYLSDTHKDITYSGIAPLFRGSSSALIISLSATSAVFFHIMARD